MLGRVSLLQNSQQFGKGTFKANPHTVILVTHALRIRSGTAPPKFATIRQTGVFQGKIFTALIWQHMRSEFGPAHVVFTTHRLRFFLWLDSDCAILP
jgi:hypothetical protein